MKKLITFIFSMFLLLSCNPSTDSNEPINPTVSAMNIPERFWGEMYSVNGTGGLYAKIQKTSITVELSNNSNTNLRTFNDLETTLDNELNHFEAKKGTTKLVLLKGNGFIGITIYENGATLLSAYYH